MDRFDEAFARRNAGDGFSFGKIQDTLDGRSAASFKCKADDYEKIEAALANLSKEQRALVKISRGDGFVSVDISASPQPEDDDINTKKEADKKKEQDGELKDNEDKMNDRLDKDKKNKAKNKKQGKAGKAQTAKIENEAAERASKLDKAVDKGKKAKRLKKAENAKAFLGHTSGNAAKKGTEKIAEKALGKTTEKTAAKIAGKAAGKAATKTAAKIAGKAAFKSLLKKIPVVSLAAGCFFAYQRVKEGDWKGACGEIASGALGCVPGIGTAASVAVDAGLAARDIYNASPETKAATDKIPAIQAKAPKGLSAEIDKRYQPQRTSTENKILPTPQQQAIYLQKQAERG